MSDSFPCIICGKTLRREIDEYEGQPRDGVMCSTSGNYGSTVFDPMDYSFLAFNICDPCLVIAGEQGRVMTTRSYAKVIVPNLGVVGRTACNRPYIPWNKDLADENVDVRMDIDELETYVKSGKVELHRGLTIESLKESYEHYEKEFDRG